MKLGDNGTVLVTGGGGFIGSHVVERVVEHFSMVKVLVHYNGRSDPGHLKSLRDDYRKTISIVYGDVRDPGFVHGIVDGCDTVIHLAALIGIPYSYLAPSSYVETNILGTFNILEACRRSRVKRVVITSTSEVYGTALYSPIDELHPLQAQSPYSATKIAADKLAESYFRSFDVPVVTLRPFNTYGDRQSSRAIIPTIFGQAFGGAEEIKLGNIAPRRDLTYVTDTARAFVLAATIEGLEGETIHCGQGGAVSMGELAQKCLEICGSNARIVSTEDRQRPEKSEVELLLCDPSKAKKLLGWKPEVSFDEGLYRTASYIREHLSDYRLNEYVV